MADIFLSYKREDVAKIKPLVRILRRQNFEVWWDPKIVPGERFGHVIRRELDAARCVVVAWSERSIESSWVVDEAAIGRDRGILVPVTIDGALPPLGFGQFQTADLRGWSGKADDPRVQSILKGVRKALDRSDQASTGLLTAAVSDNTSATRGGSDNARASILLRGRGALAEWFRANFGWKSASFFGAAALIFLLSFYLPITQVPVLPAPTPLIACPWGHKLSLQAGSCEPIICPDNRVLNSAGTACELQTVMNCPSGTRLNMAGNGCEAIVCEPGARLNGAGDGCEQFACASGTRLNMAGNGCEAIVCVPGARLNGAGNGCEQFACASGTRLNTVGDGCEAIVCERGTRLNGTGSTCEQVACARGTRLNALGNGCEMIACARGTRLNSAGNGCEAVACSRGTRLNDAGDSCQPIVCRSGTRLNVASNACEVIACQKGTRLNSAGNGCEQIPAATTNSPANDGPKNPNIGRPGHTSGGGGCASIQGRCAVQIGGECDPATGRWSYGNRGNKADRADVAFNNCISQSLR